MTRPLDGITVVSLEHAIAAPFCTRQLADLGARVIKVERPGTGDFARAYDTRVKGHASHFVWTNRSKESLTLDLKQPDALAVLKQLLAKADVLVQNLAPGAVARMGLSFEALSKAHPGLIVCDISGYGEDGPYRDKKAYDLLIQSEAGFLSITGTPEAPSKAGNSVADIAAGMYAYTSILSALLLRGKTGQGSHIDVSMLESLGEWMGYPLYYAFDGAPQPPRTAAAHASIYPYGPFQAGDDGTVMLGLQNEREWKVFCEVLQNATLVNDLRFDSNARRNEHREALKTIILDAFRKHSTEKFLARLDEAQIANACLNDMAELWAHSQLKVRQRVIYRRFCRRVAATRSTTVWLRQLPRASIPKRFCTSWGKAHGPSRLCTAPQRFDELARNELSINVQTAQLVAFAAKMRFDAIPAPVVRRTEDLSVDWFGSAVVGYGSRSLDNITRFALSMGPKGGPSDVIIKRLRTSPYLAAMAVAQVLGASNLQLLTASVTGYEVGIRVGEFLGRSHCKMFHINDTAGTLAAATAVDNLLGLDAAQMQHAFGTAGTLSAGQWEFLRTAADSTQLHTTHPVGAGLMAAHSAKDGFAGYAQIFEGPQGMAAGMSSDANPARLNDGLCTRWATVETSFKHYACCRHAHPAADALLQVMQLHGLQPQDLAHVVTQVHQDAIDVLGPVVNSTTVHQSKFSMGMVLALVARFGHAGLTEFAKHFQDEATQQLRDRVEMAFDVDVDDAYPQSWIGKVTAQTMDGRVLQGRVDEPKGDPGNTLSREEITAKALRLAAFSGGATAAQMRAAVQALWDVARWSRVGALLECSA